MKSYFKKVKEKSKDPDNYNFKILLSAIYETLISKGITTKQEIDDLIQEIDIEVDNSIDKKKKTGKKVDFPRSL